MVKEQVDDVQLALVGSMATDDPEGWDFFQQTHEHAAGDEDIKILNNLNNVGAIEVNAFQSQADVVLQKSIREGFGLTVSEALWKARPTIAGNVGGIPLQIQDGTSGFLVNSPEEAAQACIEVLTDPELGKRLGRAGKEYVRTHFLMPRLLRDWLRIFTDLSMKRVASVEQPLVLLSNRGPATFERDECGAAGAAARRRRPRHRADRVCCATARRSGSPPR